MKEASTDQQTDTSQGTGAEPDQPAPAAVAEAEAYCSDLIAAIKSKAEHNKNESLWCFMAIVICTTAVPVLVMLGDSFWFAKVLPSTLSAFATGLTAWLQLRKPQQLWALYRTAQRELEDHQTRYRHRLDAYGPATDRHKILAENAADIAIDLHYDWLPVVPTVQQLSKSESQAQSRRRRRNKT